MKHTVQKLADIAHNGYADEHKAGHDLAMAMASDQLSYHDAHMRIHSIMKALACAEKCLADAAFYQLSMDNRPIDMQAMQNGKKHDY